MTNNKFDFGEIPPIIRDSLGFLLGEAYRRVAQEYETCFADLQLQYRQAWVIIVLKQKGTMSQQSIGDMLSIDRTTMVKFIDELERLKILKRLRNTTDRRSYYIFLTAYGEKIYETIMKSIAEMENALLANIPNNEQRLLRDFLCSTIDNAFLK